MLRGGRRRHARARPRVPGRASSEVARAPPDLSPPPPLCWCARADTGCGGGGPWRARAPRRAVGGARRSGRSESVHESARSTGARGIRTGPGGGEGKARERSRRARAPPKGCSCLFVTLPRQAGLSREQVAGMPAPGRGGGGALVGHAWASGVRGLHRATRSGSLRGHGPAPERASPQSDLSSPPCTPGKGRDGAVGRRVRTRSGLAAGPEALDKRGRRLSRMGPEGGAEFREVTEAGTARKSPRPLDSARGLREPKVV